MSFSIVQILEISRNNYKEHFARFLYRKLYDNVETNLRRQINVEMYDVNGLEHLIF